MFTGLIGDVGTVVDVQDFAKGKRFLISSHFEVHTIALGASIACDGACLTVVSVEPHKDGSQFIMEASQETLKLTTLNAWQKGQYINLERALKVGDELGGHWVSGHVDGKGRIENIYARDDFYQFEVSLPEPLLKFVAKKGSIALDGISLTVNELHGDRVSLTLIPHTLAHTTWGKKKVGDSLNVEIDLMARYGARLLEAKT